MIYIKLECNGKDYLAIPNGAFYFYNASPNYYEVPLSFSAVVNIEKDEGDDVNFTSQNCSSYQWTASKLVMHAISIEDPK